MDRQSLIRNKPRTYEFDPEFWVALLFLRNHLIRDERFTHLIYGSYGGSAQPLREAFDFVDDIIQAALDRGWMDSDKA